MKYIRFAKNPLDFVVFGGHIKHVDVAEALKPLLGDPVSAGFVERGDDGKPQCVGESDGLKLHARPSDTTYLRAIEA